MTAHDPDSTQLIEPKPNKCLVFWNRTKWYICGVVFLLLICGLIGTIVYTEMYIHSHKFRIDCNFDLPLNYKTCLNRGCLWVQRIETDPPCFYPNGYGYHYTKIDNSTNGVIKVELKRETSASMFGNEIDLVNLIITFETDTRIRLKFVDAKNEKRYEVPQLNPNYKPGVNSTKVDYNVEFTNDPQFGIRIKRISSDQIIFDTNVPGMIYSDQFLQVTTKLASGNIYGFGERLSYDYKVSTDWKRMTFFARDMPPISESNIYGVHPFYMNLEKDGNMHGVFLHNSNAMEIAVLPYPAITFRTIGGILDFYVFLGPTPEDVVKQYLEVVGLPMLPPYWSLGFQLSRYGYKSVDDVRAVVTRTIKNDMPYDVQFFDIDYMDAEMTFTIDSDKFGTLKAFVDELHKQNVKVVLILDPFIASNRTLMQSYRALYEGVKQDVFIKVNGTILEGNCWPGDVYYPDFSHPNAPGYWSDLISKFREEVEFDGLWIDMNEPSNFVEGSLKGCARNTLNYPPYPAGVLGSEKDGKLFEKTICMDADQYIGKHYDVHSLYGTYEAQATYNALKKLGKRPMVLSRSTYSGAGQYTAHWLGDNFATWLQLRASIPGILQFSTFGFPMIGSDICGFWTNTTKELCSRWMQLGAFYPFSRNHNGLGCIDQDPSSLGSEVLTVSLQALRTRYKLLPYLYSLFYYANTDGSTVARPLFHEFPKDEKTWDINYQFLWGPALMISPIVYEGAKSVDAYFPEGIWYNFYTGVITKQEKSETLNLLDNGQVNLHVRGGYILPLQTQKRTTEESRKEPMGLFIAPDAGEKATGSLFWDDGVSYGTVEEKKYTLLSFIYEKIGNYNELVSTIRQNNLPTSVPLNFGFMTLCQQKFKPSQVTIGDQVVTGSNWEYFPDEKVLQVKNISVTGKEPFSVKIYR